MSRAQIFPAVLIVLDVAAAAMWALEPDWRKVVYWLAAAILTVTVTF